MSTRGIEDVDIYEGNINGEIFNSFIVQSLVPLLQPFDGKSGTLHIAGSAKNITKPSKPTST